LIAAASTRRQPEPRWRSAVGWVAVALLLAAALAANARAGHLLRIATINADTLWSYAFVRDVVEDGGRLADWDFGPHSDLFPDRPVTLAAYAIAPDPQGFLLAYGALNSLLLLAVFWRILFLHRRAACGPQRAAELSFLAALPAALLPLVARSWGLFRPFLSAVDFPSWHFSACLATMLAAVLAIDAFDRPPMRLARPLLPAVLLLLLCGLSDRLALLTPLAPFLGACLFYATLSRRLPPGLAIAAGAFLGATGAVLLGHDALWRPLARLDPIGARLQLAGIAQQLRLLLRLLFPPDLPLQGLAAALLLAAALGLAARLLARFVRGLAGGAPAPRPDKADAMLVMLLAIQLLQPLETAAFGMLSGPVDMRYVYPALLAALLAVAARLGAAIPPGWPAIRVRRLAALACVAALLVPWPARLPAIPPPPLARCLDRLAESRPMTLGLGFHWDTYVVDFFSARGIRVRSIDQDATVRHWINDIAWFAPAPGRPPFSFVALGPHLDEGAVRARYGAPAAVLDCAALGPGFGDRRILWYDAAGAARLTAAVEAQYAARTRR
jgi:hypothetical protein